MQRSIRCALGLALIASAGCTDFNSDRTIEVETTGTIVGLAFLDRNGNGTFDATVDGPVPGIAVRIVPSGAFTPAARVTTAPTGVFGAPNLPVGDYDVIIETNTVPDSIRLLSTSTTTARVTPGDSVGVFLTLSYPAVKIREAKTMPTGRRVFVEGVTLNAWATYGDSTLHVVDSTGVIRATRVAPSNVTSGQRVRLLGTTDLRDGLPTLTDASVFALSSAPIPPATVVTTAVASTASNGTLDGALVQIAGAVILGGTVNAVGDLALTVNDGSGLLEVVIDRSTNISATQFIAGALLSATGLLVPSGTAGHWMLKPRSAPDITVSFPTATIAQARLLPLGRLVSVEGVALNSWITYADSTVHMADSTGSIRVTRVQLVNLFAGNRVRMLGVVGFRDGQPVITNATASVLGDALIPLAPLLSTAIAATADGGRLDAALVRVANAVIADTATVIIGIPGQLSTGDFVVHVNDGSGPLEVVFDRDSGFQLGAFIPGATLNITGLMVPLTNGRDWRLKPRQASDVVVVR